MSAIQPQDSAEAELLRLITENQYYPERLAMILWKWGEGELAGIDEPDQWQMEDFRWLGQEMRARREEFEKNGSCDKILDIKGSGRGIGKSADVGMLVTIFLAAFPDTKITVMANSGQQLDTKTWPEVRKWMRRSIVSHWFESNSSIIYRQGARDSWFATPITWNLENPQASAGQQNLHSLNVFIFDEMSEIPDKIIEVSMSGLTTGMPIALGRGNPTMATGVFADALNGEYAYGYWHAQSIDSRTCRFPNKKEIQDDIERYGLDSDYVRVWRLGLPPKTNIGAYFPDELITAAKSRRPVGLRSDALVASCDFAWGGKDPNLIRFRHGLDMWSIKPLKVEGSKTADPDFMIGVLADVLSKKFVPAGRPDGMPVTMLFVDGAGIASVVCRRLRELGFKNVVEVNFAAHALDMKRDKNVRAQIIRSFKEFLYQGAGIDDFGDESKNLEKDMRAIQVVRHVPLQFEEKDKIRERLKRSTDNLDACALLFYQPVVLADVRMEQQRIRRERSRALRQNQQGVASAWT